MAIVFGGLLAALFHVLAWGCIAAAVGGTLWLGIRLLTPSPVEVAVSKKAMKKAYR